MVNDPAYEARTPRRPCSRFNWLSATGTAILLAALATALYLRIPIGRRAWRWPG